MPTYVNTSTEAELKRSEFFVPLEETYRHKVHGGIQTSTRRRPPHAPCITVDEEGRHYAQLVAHGKVYKFYPGEPVEVPEVSRARLQKQKGALHPFPVKEMLPGSEAWDQVAKKRYDKMVAEQVALQAAAPPPEPEKVVYLPPESILRKCTKTELQEMAGQLGVELGEEDRTRDILAKFEAFRARS